MSKLITWSVAILAWSLAGAAAYAGERHYYYTDPQGTVLAKADVAGRVIETADYRPYGARALGATANGPGYTGHVNDADSGLVYMQARYYDPYAQHFLSVDPVTPVAGDSFNFNRYAYVNNNPIMHVDPNGMACGGNGEVSRTVQALRDSADGCQGSEFRPTVGEGGSFGGAGATGSWGTLTPIVSATTSTTPEKTTDSSPRDSMAKTTKTVATGGAVVANTAAATRAALSSGLSGGPNSVFWSGYAQGARHVAESLGGTTLESTPVGRILDFASNRLGVPGLGPVWNQASATFAANATGTARAVIFAEGATWTNIELPILIERAVPIILLTP